MVRPPRPCLAKGDGYHRLVVLNAAGFIVVAGLAPRFVVLKGADDIKDTVRTAATSTLRVIGKMTVRMANLDVSSRPTAQRAVDIALPFLIDQGMVNGVKEIQVGCCVE